EAQRKIEHDRVFEVLSSLPLHSKILLYSAYMLSKNNSEATTGSLYDVYRVLCERFNVEALTQRRVNSLLTELAMLGILDARIVNLGRYGRTKKIRVNVSEETFKKVFSTDERLKFLGLSGK
ncbi:cell division control protein Cdc6, partial [Candidatus Bathyarchaeota archaeon]